VRSGAEPSIAAFNTVRKSLAPHGAAEVVLPPVEPPVSVVVSVSVTVAVTVAPLDPELPLPPHATAVATTRTEMSAHRPGSGIRITGSIRDQAAA